MIERYVVTGAAKDLTETERRIVTDVIDGLPPGSVVVSGAAPRGVDPLAAYCAQTCGLRVLLVYPAAPFDQALPQAAKRYDWTSYYALAGRTDSESYMLRNDLLADFANGHVALAFPRTTREERRSGTWATVRRFRKRDVKRIEFYPLNGAAPWREEGGK